MDKRLEVIEFLKDLAGTGKVEFNDLKNLKTFDEAYGKETMYFCAGMDKKPVARCKDNDFTKKKYFVVDVDIRADIYAKEKRVIGDEELGKIGIQVIKRFNEGGFDDYSYVVFSGNGIHFYFVGDEVSIDLKDYALGVQYIYAQLDILLYDLGVRCDAKCNNIGRIMRLPGSINTRKKMKGSEVIRELPPIECDIYINKKKHSSLLSKLFGFAETIKKQEETEKKTEQYIRQVTANVKKDDKIFDEINRIPAHEVASIVRGVGYKDCGKDNCPLLEKNKNMGAYYWKPSNVVVNTGSSLIKNKNEKYFTTYRLVRDEMMNGDIAGTIRRFKERYNIQVLERGTIPPKKEYETKGFLYGNKVFDQFDCMMSGELVVVVAKTNSGKTTFAMNMLQENKKIDKEGFYINLEFAIETVAKSRRLFLNGKSKKHLTDLAPLTDEEQRSLEKYVENYLSKFKYHNNPKGETIEDVIDLIIKKNDEGFELFVLDSFSKIKGNSDSEHTRGNQNTVMQKLQELCQSLGIVIVVLHHTNKAGEFEGSQKIMDDSNVFIVMGRDVSPMGTDLTKFTLTKDKFVSYTEIQAMYDKGEYIPMF